MPPTPTPTTFVFSLKPHLPLADSINLIYSPSPPPATLHPSITAGTVATEQGDEGLSSTQSLVVALAIAFISTLCILGFILAIRRKHRGKAKPTNVGEGIVHMGVTYAGCLWTLDFLNFQGRGKIDRETQSSRRLLGPQDSPVPDKINAMLITDDAQRTRFLQKRPELEETDITLALGFAFKNYPCSEIDLGLMERGLGNSPVGGQKTSWETKSRFRQGSDASRSTQQTLASDVFSTTTGATHSSQTFVTDVEDDSDLEEAGSEDMEFEVTRVQTQSIEIKKGILVDWNVHNPAGQLGVRLGGAHTVSIPSLVVTCPSTTTLSVIGPSFSSVSVDLNDFPEPP